MLKLMNLRHGLYTEKLLIKIYEEDIMIKYCININNIVITQLKKQQSTTLDSVLLEDFVKINIKSKKILEIGSGFGFISLSIAKRSKANVVGVEINKDVYEISLENKNNNNIINLDFINIDINNYKSEFKFQEFDIIISNPPYFKMNNDKKQKVNLINARHENSLTIKKIFEISSYLLKNSSSLYLIFRSERLAEIIKYSDKMILKRIKPVYTKKNDEKSLIMLAEFKKNVKEGLIVEKPIYIYDDNGKRSEYIERLYRK